MTKPCLDPRTLFCPGLGFCWMACCCREVQVEFEQSVVAGLGTVCVKGFHQSFEAGVPSGEAAPEKPVLVSKSKYVVVTAAVVVVVVARCV